ncbi:TetR/AcrR family transcriptional regulator [Streptomyces sp. NPDC002018]|uniref:TetR/AcrR family transcriptional regulator n=1 Tax=Streptomyces sp. NPDC002018 TaxID=3364629 RepID=UPI0036C2EB2A
MTSLGAGTEEWTTVDPRIARTAHALETAVVALASERPASRITVSELADRAGVSRATFYNRFGTPLDVLIQVLRRDLDAARRVDDDRRAGGAPAETTLRLATGDIADHVLRFGDVYRQALDDPADRGVYEALTGHFTEYSLAFIDSSTHPATPRTGRRIAAQFVSHGFAGAIKAWLADDTLTRDDLVDAVTASAPVWWS